MQQEIVRLNYQILYLLALLSQRHCVLSGNDCKTINSTWNSSFIRSSSIFIYFGLKTNWIATIDLINTSIPLKKFDFPDPFTPTINYVKITSRQMALTPGIETNLVFCSRISLPKPWIMTFLICIQKIECGTYPRFGGVLRRSRRFITASFCATLINMQFHYSNTGARSKLSIPIESQYPQVGKWWLIEA